MQQAQDFLEESRALDALLTDAGSGVLETITQFKAWTIADVLRHLHVWNSAVLMALQKPEDFHAFFAPIAAHTAQGGSLRDFEFGYTKGLNGTELLETWRDTYQKTAAAFLAADPAARVVWAGPSMSARSSISARQMETWAHGHEVFDVLGRRREEHDRIRNVVVLGVNTFGWTFMTRNMPVPEPMPALLLVAPSGEEWHYGEPQPDNCIRGSAVGFAQVVTQTRNVADTDLVLVGEPAHQWMANAQCFAGDAAAPPAPGTRYQRTG